MILLFESVPWAGSKEWSYLVIGVLSILSVIALGIIIEKFLDIRKSLKFSREYVPKVAGFLRNFDFTEALSLSERYKAKSHLSRVVLSGLLEFQHLQGELSETQVVKHAQMAMERVTLVRQAEFEDGLGLLDAIGRTAPFIGALGGTPETFAFGIILAAPTTWYASTVRLKISWLLGGEMKNSASELITHLERNYNKFTKT